ncbi:FlgK family flagellar hook-associated protein [Buchnera aphidicola]|uniref:Flagellar hook-associated protein 1 n=1 Tax=Buchnera aphidicola str. Ua (Uroleucon ambrosiae) TaxID=1005057 RepID=G2LPK0_BUCUM|nr:flagellar hook protein [Buchnera aphidicola]AEO08137.1 flagellar hook-associated protein 1 [Buchnera aphidicola str. Ua (Uroleucon ambrosiae)]
MSTVLNTAIAGINAMKVIIDHTVDKINNPNKNHSYTQIFTDNVIEDYHPTVISLKIQEIYDEYNDFITEEKRITDAQIHNETKKIEQLIKLEDLLCEKSNIFNELVNELYYDIKQDMLLNHPKTINQNIKKKLHDITALIKDFDKKLSFLEQDVKQSVINNIKKANELIDAIHDMTVHIRYFPIARMHNTINNLIDKRDNLVDELNTLVGVKVIKNHDNYAIYLNNNISLIDNNHKQNLMPLTSKYDDKYVSIGYAENDHSMPVKIENMIPSAVLGSLLQFRKEELTNARNKIGQLTVDFANYMNQYAKLGYNIFGNQEKKIFKISDPQTIQSSTNTSSTQTLVQWKDTSNPQDTDYIIYFKNNVWTVTKMLDHSMVAYTMDQKDNITSINFDGIQLLIKGQHADGDIYMIKPYPTTLETLELLDDTNDPFELSSEDNMHRINQQNTPVINQFNIHTLIEHQEKLDQAYQKFSKAISYKYHILEEKLPFEKSMVKILDNKKMTVSHDINTNFNELNYEQACYLANVKVLETAEKIFNEIIDCYS